MNDREIIRVSLEEGSLDELVAGPLVARFALFEHPDDEEGVYRIRASEPSDDRGRGFLLAAFPGCASLGEPVPDVEPDESSTYWMGEVRKLLGWDDGDESSSEVER